MGKRKRKSAAAKKKPTHATRTSPRRSARKSVPLARKPAPKKVAPKAHARKRAPAKLVDWSKRAAPKKGSKARAAYEKSPTYRKRQRSQKKAQETRRKNAAREQRRLAREERVAIAKERLGPLLAKVVSDFKRARRFGDARQSHANWYGAKAGFGSVMRKKDFERVLEELSLENDLDDLGWDIVY